MTSVRGMRHYTEFQPGRAPWSVWLTDEQALDKLTRGVRLVPTGGVREVVAEIRADVAAVEEGSVE